MTTQSNPQVWDPDNTYSINELVQNRIKTNQQINLANFNALQFPQEEKFHYNNFKIAPKAFDKVLIEGKYNYIFFCFMIVIQLITHLSMMKPIF